ARRVPARRCGGGRQSRRFRRRTLPRRGHPAELPAVPQGEDSARSRARARLLVAMVAVELRTAEPIVALRLLSNRLFRSSTGVLTLASIGFLGTLYAISLYYQD